MSNLSRRNFLSLSALSLPVVAAGKGFTFNPKHSRSGRETKYGINFLYDGYFYSADEYVSVLDEINRENKIIYDLYGSGGVVEELEKKMAVLTGKEKAIFMPTGTMANQLAISVLSGEKTKVAVQENSHVYRDEGDAPSSVFGKRLVPFPKDKSSITLDDVKNTLAYSESESTFIEKSDMGVISIENPVRRGFGQQVKIEEIRKIAAYCKQHDYKLHLDGARIFMASGYSGIPVIEYAKNFDTVYISLYKYFGAAAGAVLCGDAEVIDKMQHLIKIHGGNLLGAWPYAAVALHFLEGFENRFQQAIENGSKIIAGLNQIDGFHISPVADGTNIFFLHIEKKDQAKVAMYLKEKYQFFLRPRPLEGITGLPFVINETQLQVPPEFIVNAFEEAVHAS